jgi:hypothetical protein
VYEAVPNARPASFERVEASDGAASASSGGAARRGRDGRRDAEIQHLHAGVRRDLDVGRLEIAMHDAAAVRGHERQRDLLGDVERGLHRQPAARQAVGQCRTLDQLEHERADALVFFELVDGGDVGVVHRREQPRFALEPSVPRRIGGEARRQDLERDVAAQAPIAGAIDLAHAAVTQHADHVVAAERLARLQPRLVRVVQLVNGGQVPGERAGDRAARGQERSAALVLREHGAERRLQRRVAPGFRADERRAFRVRQRQRAVQHVVGLRPA